MAKNHAQSPAGPIRYNGLVQVLRALAFVIYMLLCSGMLHATQLLALPLYFIRREYYHAVMIWTKSCFGILITSVCQWWSPTTIRVSGDASVRGQLRQTEDGLLECSFPERLVLIANHQLYSDWLYLWWIAYANRMHGHVYIILKESLKYVPLVGPGMMFFEFIFLSRNWAKDRPRLVHHMARLKTGHAGPRARSGPMDPMWLMIFPEGTNLSRNGRNTSAKWAEKQGIKDLQYQLLPRSTGTRYCLQELKGTVQWVYDCTVAYEGIPRDKYGQDIFTLHASFFQGRPPKSVNMYWRRFAMSSIPLDDAPSFERWILDRWREKDDLLDFYMQHGRFPATSEAVMPNTAGLDGAAADRSGYIETEVRQKYWWDFGQIFVAVIPTMVVGKVISMLWARSFAAKILG